MSKDDIVERLRAGFFCREEAADEIERLRAKISAQGRRDHGLDAQHDAQLEGLAMGLLQRGEKSAAHIVRLAIDRLGVSAQQLAILAKPEAFVTYAKDGHILIGGSSEEKKEDLPCPSRASHYS